MKQLKSLRQLAREIQISPAYLSMIVSGQRNPSAQLRNKLCSLGMLTGEAKFSLGSKHSTTELHPHHSSL
ncbi:helix-turn-helix domain-containing protein [Chloroflexota bacterium]